MDINEPVTLISLYAENVKTLRAVRIEPETGLPVFSIGGRNGAGKSTIIDCLKMSFQGGRAIPDEPIRHGERFAHIRTVIGRDGKPVLTIELDLSIAKKPRLVVRNADGDPISTPQETLNKLYEHVGFDPLEFSRFDKDKQADIIMRLAKLDFTEDDAEYSLAFEARKNEKKKLAESDLKFKGMVEHRGVPAEETSVKDALQKLSLARSHNDKRVAAGTAVGTAKGKLNAALANVAELEKELEEARAAAASRATELKAAEEALAALAPAQDVTALEQEAESTEETNRKVRENKARQEVLASIHTQEAAVAAHDAKLIEITARKKAKVAAAKFPIPELSFDIEAGLLLNDAPLKQASDGEKLRLSVAIAIALNPTLKLMLIKQGNLLDASARTMITKMAAEAGALVIMEMVSETGAGCSVYLEDGEIKEPTAAAAE